MSKHHNSRKFCAHTNIIPYSCSCEFGDCYDCKFQSQCRDCGERFETLIKSNVKIPAVSLTGRSIKKTFGE